ncbi:MAG: hypothetical protein IT350_14610 [Deltaproteobacteria bacterium]|nr:hypothetical protein [Deltaproteobacteria bacterium]
MKACEDSLFAGIADAARIQRKSPACACDTITDGYVGLQSSVNTNYHQIATIGGENSIDRNSLIKKAILAREFYERDPAKQKSALVNALAVGLHEPRIFSSNPSAKDKNKQTQIRVIINVPTLENELPELAVPFERNTFKLVAESFLASSDLRFVFASQLRRQLSELQWERLAEFSKKWVRFVRQNEKIPLDVLRKFVSASEWSPKLSTYPNVEFNDPPVYMPDDWPCAYRFPQVRNPSWYHGFISNTSFEFHGYSTSQSPIGLIRFAAGQNHQRELLVPLPGEWNGTSIGKWTYPLATSVADSGPNHSFLVYPDAIEAMGDLAFTLFSYYQLDTGDTDQDSEVFLGSVIVWNSDLWRCCLEPVPVDFQEESAEWKGAFSNVMDSIQLCAVLPPPDNVGPAVVRIDRFIVTLNNAGLLGLSSSFALTTDLSVPLLDLSDDIHDGRLKRLEPILLPSHGAEERIQSFLVLRNRIVRQAVGDLGQAWSQKYGGTWFYKRNAGWNIGPYNWCSESGMWFIRKAASANTGLDFATMERFYDGLDIGLSYWARWFLCQGRYACWRTEQWSNLGNTIWPGYWVRVNGGTHAVLFLYWTLMDGIENEMDPADPANDFIYEASRNNSINRTVSRFDPKRKINRFRSIAGNQGARVNFSTYNLIRIDDLSEIDAWAYRSTSERNNNFVFWRNDEDGQQEFLQDGFGNTYTENKYTGDRQACWELFNR